MDKETHDAFQRVVTLIREQESITVEALKDGRPNNFEDYKYMLGVLKGFSLAIGATEEAFRSLLTDEE